MKHLNLTTQKRKREHMDVESDLWDRKKMCKREFASC